MHDSFGLASLASQGFADRVLRRYLVSDDTQDLPLLDLESSVREMAYGGVPAIAMTGFGVGAKACGSEPPPTPAMDAFLEGLRRLRGRPSGGRDELFGDDVETLGIADGLSRIATLRPAVAEDAKSWLAAITDGPAAGPTWSRRMCALAGDLLDQRGRLRTDIGLADIDAVALDLTLRNVWSGTFSTVAQIGRERQVVALEQLLIRATPLVGELDRAAAWICALHQLVHGAADSLVPSVDEVVQVLRETQGALKRWVWEDGAGRIQAGPARWLIDSEPHVQAFLWAILYPKFGAQLRDEQYLPGFGLKQPRYDFGVANLKLIVEVKFIRAVGDFKKIEEEVAGDTGLYFSDPAHFDQMVVYVYDDADEHHPERYDALRNALRQRDSRIVEVVIVRRPGMLPNRTNRKQTT